MLAKVYMVFNMRTGTYMKKTWKREGDLKNALNHGMLQYIKDDPFYEVHILEMNPVDRYPLTAYNMKGYKRSKATKG